MRTISIFIIFFASVFILFSAEQQLDRANRLVPITDVEIVQQHDIELEKRQTDTQVLKFISDLICKNEELLELRREVKTKYELLRGKDDEDLVDDIDSLDIPVVQVKGLTPVHTTKIVTTSTKTLEVNTVIPTKLAYFNILKVEDIGLKIDTLVYFIANFKTLNIDTVLADGLTIRNIIINPLSVAIVDTSKFGVNYTVNSIPVLLIKDVKFSMLLKLWETKYQKIIDFRDESGNIIIPMNGTILHKIREDMYMLDILSDDFDVKLQEYNDIFNRAIDRRINLKRKKIEKN